MGGPPVSRALLGSFLDPAESFPEGVPYAYVFPSLLLDRGATKEEYRGRALNAALRYYFFLGILNLPIYSVLGAV